MTSLRKGLFWSRISPKEVVWGMRLICFITPRGHSRLRLTAFLSVLCPVRYCRVISGASWSPPLSDVFFFVCLFKANESLFIAWNRNGLLLSPATTVWVESGSWTLWWFICWEESSRCACEACHCPATPSVPQATRESPGDTSLTRCDLSMSSDHADFSILVLLWWLPWEQCVALQREGGKHAVGCRGVISLVDILGTEMPNLFHAECFSW